MTETRRVTTIEGQFEAALAAVRAVQARGLCVMSVHAGVALTQARVQIVDPGHVLDDLGRHGVAHLPAHGPGLRSIMERYTVLGDACVCWRLAEAEARA